MPLSQILVAVSSTLLATIIIALFSWLLLRTRWSKSYRKATFHIKRGEALQKAKQFVDAREEIEKAVRILEDEQRYKELSEAYLRLGDIDINLKKWENALRNYILCRDSAEQAIKGIISPDVIYLRLGKGYSRIGKLDDAFRFIDEARKIQEKVENHPLLAETYSKLGEIENRRYHYEVAMEYHLRALTYQERIHDLRSQAATHASLAELHMKEKNGNEALTHYSTASELYMEVGDLAIVELLKAKMDEIKLKGK